MKNVVMRGENIPTADLMQYFQSKSIEIFSKFSFWLFKIKFQSLTFRMIISILLASTKSYLQYEIKSTQWAGDIINNRDGPLKRDKKLSYLSSLPDGLSRGPTVCCGGGML